jgi:hypothetical protein
MPRDVADQLRLTPASRDFLVHAGLPVDVGFNNVGFDVSGPVVRRHSAEASLIQISRPRTGLAAICLDEARGARVVQLEASAPAAEASFLNSSVEQHAECWLAWRTVVDSSSGEADVATAERLRTAFQAIDAAAVAHDELPWAILIHEVEIGVL